MLNGIGGCTVEEAKSSMTYVEFLDWVAFIKKRGSLHLGMRVERGFALVASRVIHAAGGKSEMRDYMPHYEEPEPISLEEAMRTWK